MNYLFPLISHTEIFLFASNSSSSIIPKLPGFIPIITKMHFPVPISVVTLGLIGIQTLTATFKSSSNFTAHPQNGTLIPIDVNLMDGPANITTTNLDAVKGASFIVENAENVTMAMDAGIAVHVEYTRTPGEEAREQHYIQAWHRQISAEVMQAMALKKRDAKMAGPIAGAEGTTGQGVPSLWKRYFSVSWLYRCWYGQWRIGRWFCDNDKLGPTDGSQDSR
jgi:hypothetical protein